MGRGEVDVGVFGVVQTASLSVGVEASGHTFEVAGSPCVDGDHEDGCDEGQEYYEATAVSALALLD